MANRRQILIDCPQCRQLVTGSYECDESGRYLLRADGEFDIHRARCGQRGGVCQESLCLLHRFNRRRPGTWFPTGILADREGCETGQPQPTSTPPAKSNLF